MKNYAGATGFREAITVTKREGTYHFTWSQDDTGSENYQVNYGVSQSLYGPITYKYPILQKDKSRNILGTGHHSILYIPQKDMYYIAYHRFLTPLGQVDGGFGYHREVCIDRLDFEDGLMQKVTPTLTGITEPVWVGKNDPDIQEETEESNRPEPKPDPEPEPSVLEAQKITWNVKSKITLGKKENVPLKVKFPKNTASYRKTFHSSKRRVAAVSPEGMLTAVKKGRTVITVKTFNGKKAKLKVTVK